MASQNRPMVLVVEDDALVAIAMASFLEAYDVETCFAASLATAEMALGEPVDFAFLDVNVVDGNTYQLARRLSRENVPFVFVSGSDPARVPADLRSAQFLAKPCPVSVIAKAMKTAWDKGNGASRLPRSILRSANHRSVARPRSIC